MSAWNILYHHRTRGVGAEGAHIKAITQALRTMGHRVALFSLTGVDPTQPPAPQPGSKRSRTAWLSKHLPEWLFELLELAYNLLVAIRLNKQMNRGVDLVYERYSLFMFIGVWLARRKQLPIILEVNDSAVVDRVRPLLFKRLATAIEGWIFRHASGIVFISSEFRRIAASHHGAIAPSVISPNAASLQEFNINEHPPASSKQQLGLDNQFVVGFVGAFHHWHGIHWYVRQLLPLLRQHPEMSLLLVGDGPFHGHIQQLSDEAGLANQVIMPGRVPHQQVPAMIAAMDIGILPDSNVYGSPMKLFEFMAMKVPMLCPAYPPIEEVLQEGMTGWMFPPGDQTASISATEQILTLPRADVQRIGEQAYRYIVEQRQWRHNAEQLMTLAGQMKAPLAEGG